jgi:DNA-binding HxlR family transcriptional regulator
MPKHDDNFIPGCPVRFSANVFGDRWTMILLRDLLFRGFRHYGQFLETGEGISTNILADRLGKLEAIGILTKEADPENGTRRIYALTERGAALRAPFLAIMEWGVATDPDSAMTQEFIDKLRVQWGLGSALKSNSGD